MASSHNHQGNKVQGGVPCGNPKRYQSRDVVQMSRGEALFRKRKGLLEEEEHGATEGEKHLHTMLKRQVKTEMTILEQFSHHRTFTPATTHAPGVEQLVGVHEYQNYKKVDDLDARIESLRQYGLNDEEITLKLMEEMKDEVSTSYRSYGANPEAKLERLREIEMKMKEKATSFEKADAFRGALELSRQARDLEKAVEERRGTSASLPRALTTSKLFEDSHPDDPVNCISEMLKDIEGKKLPREPRRERRRRRKLERRRMYYEKNDDIATDFNSDDANHNLSLLPESEVSFRDGKDQHGGSVCVKASSIDCVQKHLETDSCHRSSETMDKSKLHAATDQSPSSLHREPAIHPSDPCPPLPDSVRQNIDLLQQQCKPVKEITTPIRFLSMDEIKDNSISVEEIKAMDKFKNYAVGTPSKTVYVKNMPSNTTEEELISLFGQFQSEDQRIVFKLLTGRMKGQAFITFPDETVAADAIDLINGFKLRDRPIILCFGKRQG